MKVNLHANATTTPKVRAYIQRSAASVAELAKELGVSHVTVQRWKTRDQTHDRSHCRHQLGQSTTLEEETLICELRQTVGLSLDDLVEVMQRCVNPSLSRSAIYRCLKRYGVSGRMKADNAESAGKFEETRFGFVHIDLKHLTRLRSQPAYVFVAIERSTRFVYVEIVIRRDAATIAECLKNFLNEFQYPVHTILTDNGSEFTDRFAVLMKNKPKDKPTGRHPFDRLCRTHHIEHRLTRPYHPQTNGMVERFNRRLAEALRQAPTAKRNNGKNKFDTHDERNQFIHQVVYAYNRTRLKCLGYTAPIEMLNNQTEHNTKAGVQEL